MSRPQRTRLPANAPSLRPSPGPSKLRAPATLLLATALIQAAIGPARAQETGGKFWPGASVPLPPQRPAELGGAAPAAPIALPPPAPPAEPPAANPGDGSAFGFRPLPPAPRERMHACGLEWQKMKMEGAARDKIWRDFAEECLRR